MMEVQKIQVKIRRSDKTFIWSHFCYVPEELKRNFDKYVNTLGLPSNYWISKWAQENFGITKVDTLIDVWRLKTDIKNLYKERYPELFIETATDKQGWLRVWYANNMEQELKTLGKS